MHWFHSISTQGRRCVRPSQTARTAPRHVCRLAGPGLLHTVRSVCVSQPPQDKDCGPLPPPPRHTDGSENDRGLLSAQLFEEFNANREFTSGAELGSGQGSLSGWGRALKIWPKRGKVLRLQQRGQFFSGGGARLSRIRAWTWPPPPRPQQRLRKGRRNQLFPRRSIAQGLAAAAAAAAAVPSPSGRGAGHAGGVTRGVAVLRHALRTRHALRLRTRHVLRRQRRRNACWLAQICSA